MTLVPTKRGAWLAPVAIVAATYAAGVLGNLAAGPELPAKTSTGGERPVSTTAGGDSPSVDHPRPTPSPSRASRSRPTSPGHDRLARQTTTVRHDGLNWAGLAKCESSGNPTTNTGNGYYGLYQFDLRTWHSVGGSGYPHQASAAEQTYRASLLYATRGASPWPACGRWLRG